MTRIDPSRITEIFRLLTGESEGLVQHQKNDTKHKFLSTNPAKEAKSHDKDILRQRLRQRLQRLIQEDVDFPTIAPEVTIREVLIWEFGDNVTSHPEFNQIANKVIRTMQGNEKLALQLQQLIQEILN